MNSLIFIAIVIGFVVLHSWWNARKQAEEQRSGRQEPSPGPDSRSPSQRTGSPPPARPSPAANWEEELRRLLEGDSPAPPPSPGPRTVPPPVTVPPPLPARRVPAPVRPRPLAASPAPTRAPTSMPPLAPVPVIDRDMETGLPVKMPSLQESAKAYVRASQLETRVAEHMRQVDRQVTTHAKLDRVRSVSPEIKQALGLLRTRSSQRAAILAGVVLGPPRALEE